MDARERLERVREAAYGGPSGESWRRVCEALNANVVDAGMVEALEYAEALLSGWPEALRVLGDPWHKILHERGVMLPVVSLARRVSLDVGQMQRAGLEAALSNPRAAGWTSLSVLGGRGSEGLLALLARAPYPRALRALEVMLWANARWIGAPVSGEGMRALLGRWALEALELTRVVLSLEAWSALSRARLRSLSLVMWRAPSEAEVRRLLSGPLSAGLRSLSLGQVSGEALGLALDGEALPMLEELSVGAQVGAQVWAPALRRWRVPEGLRSLRLEEMPASRDTVEALLSVAGEQLKALTLTQGMVERSGVEALAHNPLRARLEALSLRSPRWEVDAVEALCAGGAWARLEELALGEGWRSAQDRASEAGAAVSEALVRVLTPATFPRMRRLCLVDSLVSLEGALALLRAWPPGSLHTLGLPWAVRAEARFGEVEAEALARGVDVRVTRACF